MRIKRLVPATLLAVTVVLPTLPAVGQDLVPGDPSEQASPGTATESPATNPAAGPEPTPTESPTAIPSSDAVTTTETTTETTSPAADESNPPAPATTPATPEPATTPVEDEVVAAAVTAADDQAMLPTGTGDQTCRPDDLTVTFEPVPVGAFTVGGYVEPLVRPADADDVGTGIVTCTSSDHAVAGFDAVPAADGTWQVHFVTPTPGTEEEVLDGDTVLDVEQAPTTTSKGLLSARTQQFATAEGSSAASSSSVPVPNWPSGMPTVADGLSSSDPQDTCDPAAKPGALALKDLLDRTYHTTRGYGISRNCGSGSRSEHKEGRAVDWMVDSYDPDEKALGDTFTDWVLSTDPWGNDYAGMQRLGIMYMIWNQRSIYSWNPEAGWRDYTGSSPHTDHVHFSLTWPGARCQTSFWVATNCTGDTGSVAPPPEPPIRSGDLATAVPADFNGDGYEDVLWYRPGSGRDPQWWGGSPGFETGGSTSIDGSYLPLHGDFDGDGNTDIIWYGPGSARDSYWQGQGDGSFVKGLPMRVRGVYEPTVGDFDGNGVDDVLWYGPGSGPDSIWYGTRNGFDSARNINVQGSYVAVAVDLNGDRRDDILWYGRGGARDSIWAGRPDRTFATGIGVRINADGTPIAGDFNANGREDVFFYAAGGDNDESWYFRRDFSTRRDTSVQIQGSYRPFAGDFDGDNRDDIFWYGPATGSDWIYYGGANGFEPVSTSVSGDYQPVAGG